MQESRLGKIHRKEDYAGLWKRLLEDVTDLLVVLERPMKEGTPVA
jgi:hypothetical protein